MWAIVSESHHTLLISHFQLKIENIWLQLYKHPHDSAHADAALLISTKIPHSPLRPKSNQHMQIVSSSIHISSIPYISGLKHTARNKNKNTIKILLEQKYTKHFKNVVFFYTSSIHRILSDVLFLH